MIVGLVNEHSLARCLSLVREKIQSNFFFSPFCFALLLQPPLFFPSKNEKLRLLQRAFNFSDKCAQFLMHLFLLFLGMDASFPPAFSLTR